MKKIILVLFIVLFSSFAFADYESPYLRYSMDNADLADFDTTITDTGSSGNDGTITSAWVGEVGMFDESFYFDAFDNSVISNSNIGISGDANRSLSLWYQFDTTWYTLGALAWWGNSACTRQYWGFTLSSTTGGYRMGTGCDDFATGNVGLNNGSWINLIYRYNAENNTAYYYVNGDLHTTRTYGGNLATVNTQLYIGERPDGGGDLEGWVDEVCVYDTYISDSDIINLQSNTCISAATNNPVPSFLAPTPSSGQLNNSQVQIVVNSSLNAPSYLFFGSSNPPTSMVVINETGVSYYNTSVVSDGTYYFFASSYDNTTNSLGTNTSIRSWTFDSTPPSITRLTGSFYNVDNTTVINRSSVNFSTSFFDSVNLTNVNVSLINTDLNTYYSLTSLSSVNAQNYTTNNTVDFSEKFGGVYNYSLGNYTIRLEGEDSFGKSVKEYTFQLVNDVANTVYFFSSITGDPVNGAEITLQYPDGTTISRNTSTEGNISFRNFHNGYYQYGLYYATVESTDGYVTPITFNFTVNTTNDPTNNSFDVTIANLNISIYDRETGSLILQNVDISFEGFQTYNTSTGFLSISNGTLAGGSQTIRVSSSNYVTEQKIFSFTNQEDLSIDVYLLPQNASNIGNTIIQVYDDFYNLIVGADTRMLEYFPASNSFVEVSQCTTDTNGECVFSTELDTKFYIFTASATINGESYYVQSTSSGQLIKLDNTIIELHMKTAEAFELPSIEGLSVSISNRSLVGNLSYYTASFQDANGASHQVCVAYYVRNELSKNLLTSNCITGSSGVVNVAGGYDLTSLRSSTIVVETYVQLGDQQIVYDSVNYPALGDDSFSSAFDLYVKPFLFFLILSLIALAVYLKNINVFAMGSILLSFFTIYTDSSLMGGITTSFIVVLSISIMYLARTKQNA